MLTDEFGNLIDLKPSITTKNYGHLQNMISKIVVFTIQYKILSLYNHLQKLHYG